MTKNTSTPSKLPFGQPAKWFAITASTAIARMPWMSAR